MTSTAASAVPGGVMALITVGLATAAVASVVPKVTFDPGTNPVPTSATGSPPAARPVFGFRLVSWRPGAGAAYPCGVAVDAVIGFPRADVPRTNPNNPPRRAETTAAFRMLSTAKIT